MQRKRSAWTGSELSDDPDCNDAEPTGPSDSAGHNGDARPIAGRPSAPPIAADQPTSRPETSGAQASSNVRSAPVATWRNTFRSLSNRNFLFMWLGMLGVMAGMQMQMLARSYLVYDITGSASLLGVVAAANALPMLGLSMFGGAFADRFDRRRIIQAGQAVFATLALVIGIAIYTDTITWVHLMIAAAVQGVSFAFMMPARQAIVPHLVEPENLTNAMALNSAAMSALTLAAPAFAGLLYAYAGPDNVYFVISGLGYGAVVITSKVPRTGGGSTSRKNSMLKEVGAGLSYVRRSPLILALMAMGVAAAVLAMPFRMLMPLFVVDVYHVGPEQMGLLVSSMGAASLIGALFVASLSNWRRGMLLIIGSFLSGFALLLLATVPVYVAAIFFMIPLGLGDSSFRTLNQSLVVENTDDRFRGRVMGVFMMNRGLMPLGVLPTSIMADFLGAQFAIGLLAVLLLLFTTTILVTQKRVREIA
ncbi:MAG: MFS transporter [SAR202 cluster bacterium]|nr:MFS transporter [SAR202 cluster bacterium]